MRENAFGVLVASEAGFAGSLGVVGVFCVLLMAGIRAFPFFEAEEDRELYRSTSGQWIGCLGGAALALLALSSLHMIFANFGYALFTGKNVAISGLTGPDGPVTLGFRAEDATVSAGQGQVNAPIYSMELLGDASMASVQAGGALVSVKASKDYTAQIGDPIGIDVPPDICHLFNRATGDRLA